MILNIYPLRFTYINFTWIPINMKFKRKYYVIWGIYQHLKLCEFQFLQNSHKKYQLIYGNTWNSCEHLYINFTHLRFISCEFHMNTKIACVAWFNCSVSKETVTTIQSTNGSFVQWHPYLAGWWCFISEYFAIIIL